MIKRNRFLNLEACQPIPRHAALPKMISMMRVMNRINMMMVMMIFDVDDYVVESKLIPRQHATLTMTMVKLNKKDLPQCTPHTCT